MFTDSISVIYKLYLHFSFLLLEFCLLLPATILEDYRNNLCFAPDISMTMLYRKFQIIYIATYLVACTIILSNELPM